MAAYNDSLASFFSLIRALFGDFDIEAINARSDGCSRALVPSSSQTARKSPPPDLIPPVCRPNTSPRHHRYGNGFVFVVYLFFAVFIMLSMFIAILGEAQAKVREAEAEEERELFRTQLLAGRFEYRSEVESTQDDFEARLRKLEARPPASVSA